MPCRTCLAVASGKTRGATAPVAATSVSWCTAIVTDCDLTLIPAPVWGAKTGGSIVILQLYTSILTICWRFQCWMSLKKLYGTSLKITLFWVQFFNKNYHYLSSIFKLSTFFLPVYEGKNCNKRRWIILDINHRINFNCSYKKLDKLLHKKKGKKKQGSNVSNKEKYGSFKIAGIPTAQKAAPARCIIVPSSSRTNILK